MNISELLAAIGDDNVQWQSLDQCADSLNMNGNTTRITFGTEQRLTLSGTERFGMVIWLDRDAIKAALASENRAVTLPEAAIERAEIRPEDLSRDERSFLLYAESCCVDAGGLLVAERMNEDDHTAARRFLDLRLLSSFGRIPSELLDGKFASATHYAELTEAGWRLAAQLRRARGDHRGPKATAVFNHPVVLDRVPAKEGEVDTVSTGGAHSPADALL